jgi:hypothetical protein
MNEQSNPQAGNGNTALFEPTTREDGIRRTDAEKPGKITSTQWGELTMPEPLELNEVLQGRKILSVEPGTTPGWMVINLELNPEERDAQPDLRLFLTVFIGGRNGSSEDNFYSTSALHLKRADGRSTADVIRDARDPQMPMASACKALGDTGRAPEDAKSEVSNVEDLTPPATDETSTSRVQALRSELELLGRFAIVSWCNEDIATALERAGADATPENIKAVREHYYVDRIDDRMTEVGFGIIDDAIHALHLAAHRAPGEEGEWIGDGLTW